MARIPDPTTEPDLTGEELVTALDEMFRNLGLALRVDGDPGCWYGPFFRSNVAEPYTKRIFFSRAWDREDARADIYQQVIAILDDIFSDGRAGNTSATHH